MLAPTIITAIDSQPNVIIKGHEQGKPFAQLSCGQFHSLALRNDGTVWAWGHNNFGQIGNDTITESAPPTQALGLTNITAVSACFTQNAALKEDGTVWVWGRSTKKPEHVKELKDASAVAAGWSHFVALKYDGTVWSWGLNDVGQLGNGTYSHSTTPVQVQGLNGVIAIAAARNHAIALKKDGTVWAWGWNVSGQLGDGTNTYDCITPAIIRDLSGVIAIDAGCGFNGYTVAVKNDGTAWACGSNEYGQLGDGTRKDRYRPVQVISVTDLTAIAAGRFHTVALRKDGTVWTWGFNEFGQLGEGTNDDKRIPVRVNGLTDIVYIDAGALHTVVVKGDGTVWAWGQNKLQLGDGTEINQNRPILVSFK